MDDEYTVSFTSRRPTLFLKALTKPNYVIVNAKQILASGATAEERQKWSRRHPTGSGPYAIDKFEPGVQLVLKAKHDYWGRSPPSTGRYLPGRAPAANRLLLLRTVTSISPMMSPSSTSDREGGTKIKAMPRRPSEPCSCF